MVWLPDHIWEARKAKGKGQKGGGVIQTAFGKGKAGGCAGLAQVIAQALGGYGGGNGFGGGNGYGGGKGFGGKGGYQNKFKIDKSGGELGEYTGTIKSFGDWKNYGFIECADLAAEHGDVFLHGDQKKGYQIGHTVKFTAVLNKEGKPVAINLKSGLKDTSDAPAKKVSQSTGSSGGKGGKGGGGGFKIDRSGGELGEFTGTIKSFNEWKGYGFIECGDLEGDVFLHSDMKKGYQQGHTVKFTAVLNKDGKPVAIDLKSGLK